MQTRTGKADGSLRSFGGCENVSPNLYDYTSYGRIFPILKLNKKFTDATPGVIEGASLALGSNISIKYYAMVCPEDVENAYMKFIRNGKEYIAYPKASNTNTKAPRQCVFVCEGMAPQTIGDNITAELYIDEALVATHDNYSVLQNCYNIYNSPTFSDAKYNNMKWLIASLINYGAAAQKYAGYKTEELVDEYCQIDLLEPTEAQSIKKVGTAISSDVKMVALGVYYDDTNKVYVKFIAPSPSGITVTINGKKVGIRKSTDKNDNENTYIAYSDDISVSEFGVEQRIVLSNGTSSQVALYSVNSYAYAKQGSANENMAELAKATYTYGEYARKYTNRGDGSYKIMSINDGDRTTFYNINNYQYVAQVINYYSPDLVGMQEVQKYDVENNRYTKVLDSNYGIIYYVRNTGLELNGNKEGLAILYKKDRFEVLDKGVEWLSNTPTTENSKLTESQYIRVFVWAKLKDKRTGEEFVFVNTHLDNKDAARLAQTKILLERTAEKFPGLPIAYTADWNFTQGSEGYQYMNSEGYYATEKLMADPYLPGGYIDFCFVDPTEFSALDYRYIYSFDFGSEVDWTTTVTDHAMVYTELALVKAAEQLPEPPEFKIPDVEPEPEIIIYGAFNSPDDILIIN